MSEHHFTIAEIEATIENKEHGTNLASIALNSHWDTTEAINYIIELKAIIRQLLDRVKEAEELIVELSLCRDDTDFNHVYSKAHKYLEAEEPQRDRR